MHPPLGCEISVFLKICEIQNETPIFGQEGTACVWTKKGLCLATFTRIFWTEVYQSSTCSESQLLAPKNHTHQMIVVKNVTIRTNVSIQLQGFFDWIHFKPRKETTDKWSAENRCPSTYYKLIIKTKINKNLTKLIPYNEL